MSINEYKNTSELRYTNPKILFQKLHFFASTLDLITFKFAYSYIHTVGTYIDYFYYRGKAFENKKMFKGDSI